MSQYRPHTASPYIPLGTLKPETLRRTIPLIPHSLQGVGDLKLFNP